MIKFRYINYVGPWGSNPVQHGGWGPCARHDKGAKPVAVRAPGFASFLARQERVEFEVKHLGRVVSTGYTPSRAPLGWGVITV